MFKGDLHCHTTCSDGSLSPVQLIMHAKAKGLSALSITDHDTVEAYKTAIEAAQQVNLRLGSGVEFSCEHFGTVLHILGYDFSLQGKEITELCIRHRARREERNRRMLRKLTELHMAMTEEELKEMGKGSISVGRVHLAQLMVKKGYVPTTESAFRSYLSEGKPGYDPGLPFTAVETIAAIHQSGGKAFLAHPHLLPRRAPLEKILTLPFNGIECYYSRRNPHQIKRWIRVAEKRGLLISGGSDFHGDVKKGVELGCSFVDQEIFEKIFEKVIV